MTKNVWLFGAGPMALDYYWVLNSLNFDICVFGRGQISAQRFQEKTGRRVVTDPFENMLSEQGPPGYAIIATNVEGLCDLTCRLLDAGVSSILVEKPGGMNRTEIQMIQDKAVMCDGAVYVGYNRRFYESVNRAQEMIEEDGGLVSMHFEFTEWSHKIAPLDKSTAVKEIWALGNSSHVMDLAFHMGGFPEELHSTHGGQLDWHPSGSVYVGSGKTLNGVLFSYHANWESAGRWGLELLTRQRRIYLRPLEELHVQFKGQLQLEKIPLSEGDGQLRPGLLGQVKSFLGGQKEILCSFEEHVKMVNIYYTIANYN